jgi:hypothetical protein
MRQSGHVIRRGYAANVGDALEMDFHYERHPVLPQSSSCPKRRPFIQSSSLVSFVLEASQSGSERNQARCRIGNATLLGSWTWHLLQYARQHGGDFLFRPRFLCGCYLHRPFRISAINASPLTRQQSYIVDFDPHLEFIGNVRLQRFGWQGLYLRRGLSY